MHNIRVKSDNRIMPEIRINSKILFLWLLEKMRDLDRLKGITKELKLEKELFLQESF